MRATTTVTCDTSHIETYNLIQNSVKSFQDLQGKVLTRIENFNNAELHFYLSENHYVRMFHEQECCEEVYVEDISGDLSDLIGTPLLLVEETSNEGRGEEFDDYYTWTYYRFRTIKGSVDIRWYGGSNGYYSERVDIEIVTKNNV